MDYFPSESENADQMPVYFGMPCNTTVAEKGTSSISVCTDGHETMCCTVILGIRANCYMLPPLLSLEEKQLLEVLISIWNYVWFQEKRLMDQELIKE